jgi:hypothetical protein
MAVVAQAAGVVPVSRLPVSEMPAQVAAVPVAVIVHGDVVTVVVVVVMSMHVVVSEMLETVAEKSMTDEAVTEGVRAAAAFGRDIDLGKREREYTGRNGGDQLC